jgi:hypothetical protein
LINHYFVKLLDFAQRTLDKSSPHCAVLCTEDLSKAYNRGSHNLVIEDLHSTEEPWWILVINCSHLKERTLNLRYQGATSSTRSLPGGFGAGNWLGGLLFMVKFNGVCLRPHIPQPLTGNQGNQFKFVDDATQIVSVNLKKSLVAEPRSRPRPMNYHERTKMVLAEEENILQSEVNKFAYFTETKKLVINKAKCYVIMFSHSRKFEFPPEFSIQESGILEVNVSHKILGIIVQDDLKWEAQVQEMARKATKTT